jgi:hypothetical protein
MGGSCRHTLVRHPPRAHAPSGQQTRHPPNRAAQVTTTVEFSRIWWDKHAKHPSLSQVSFWRPVPPPGYVALGDCMVTGMYCPPSNVLVLRDADPSQQLQGAPPLLARPLRCLQVRGRWWWRAVRPASPCASHTAGTPTHGHALLRCLLRTPPNRCGWMATRGRVAATTT